MVLFLSFLAALLVIFSPILFFDYLFHDDVYFWIKEIWAPYHYLHKLLVSMGRPLAAWVCTVDNDWIHSIGDLKLLRFLAILCFSGCAVLFFKRLRHWLKSDLHAWCVALMLVTLPGAQVNVFYSIGWFFSLAVLISCLAFELADSPKFWRLALATFVLLSAIALNQTAAMCYWVIFFISLMGGVKHYRKFFSVGMASFALYALLLMVIKWSTVKQAASTFYNPGIVEVNPFDKLIWFFQEPLVNALNLWNIFPQGGVAFGVATLIIVAVAIEWRKNKGKGFYTSLMVSCLLWVLSFLPNFAASGKAPFYRCMIALSPMVLISLVWALKQYVTTFMKVKVEGAFRPGILTATLIILALGGAGTAFANVLYHRVLPSHQEIAFFRSMTQAYQFSKEDQILIILPARQPSVERYDEFGVWTVHYQQDILLLLKSAFDEEGINEWPDIFVKSPDDGQIYQLESFVYRLLPMGKKHVEGQLGRHKILSLKSRGINPNDVLLRYAKEKVTPARLPNQGRLFILNLQSLHDEVMDVQE